MKIAGLSALALTMILSADYFGRSIGRRVASLEYFVLLIKFVKTHIGFSKTPLTRIIRLLADERQGGKNVFAKRLEKMLCDGADFYESWHRCVTDSASEMSLDESDVSLICSFASGLGVSDVVGQLENCDTYISMLEIRIKELRPQAESRSKLYNSLGMLAAGLAVLILM